MNALAAGEASLGVPSLLDPRESNFVEKILRKTDFICSVA